jgi:hypothetical protein
MADLLGNIWFALLVGMLGYLAGNVYPLRKLFK